MDDERDLIDRLRELGRQPLDTDLHASIQAAMTGEGTRGLEEVPDPPSLGRRWSRPAVVAAALAGFLLGSLGLASAGALPAGLQDRAERLLDRVGIDVPPGHLRYNDPTACPDGPYKNHGQYVRSHPDDPNAGESPCGKPLRSLGHGADATEGAETESDATGAPPDKGKDKSAQKGKDHDEGTDATTTVPQTSIAPSTASSDASTSPDPSTTTSTTATTAPPTPESSSQAS